MEKIISTFLFYTFGFRDLLFFPSKFIEPDSKII